MIYEYIKLLQGYYYFLLTLILIDETSLYRVLDDSSFAITINCKVPHYRSPHPN